LGIKGSDYPLLVFISGKKGFATPPCGLEATTDSLIGSYAKAQSHLW